MLSLQHNWFLILRLISIINFFQNIVLSIETLLNNNLSFNVKWKDCVPGNIGKYNNFFFLHAINIIMCPVGLIHEQMTLMNQFFWVNQKHVVWRRV